METKEVDKKANKPFVIANPIYDTVFKKLMEDVRIVKFFLSTILKQPVVSVDVLPRGDRYKLYDTTEKKEIKDVLYSSYIFDFKATVLTEDGKHREILIELRKSLGIMDVDHLHQYFGNHYLRKDYVIVNNPTKGKRMILPIATIYVTGNRFPDMKGVCLEVGRICGDMETEESVDEKSDIVEKLPHYSYFVQGERLMNNRYSTKLVKLLSIFKQSYFIQHSYFTQPYSEVVKYYPYRPGPEDEDFKLITDTLHEIGVDPMECKQIEDENEAIRTIHDTFGITLWKAKRTREEEKRKHEEEMRKLAEEQKRELEEKDKILLGIS